MPCEETSKANRRLCTSQVRCDNLARKRTNTELSQNEPKLGVSHWASPLVRYGNNSTSEFSITFTKRALVGWRHPHIHSKRTYCCNGR